MPQVPVDPHFFLPMPVVLVGTATDDVANFMAVGWATRANYKPPMLAVGINALSHTHAAILATGVFSVCLPPASLVAETDYCGLVSGKRTDKSGVFPTFKGPALGVPCIETCPVNLECKLTQAVHLPSNTLFIADIVSALCEEGLQRDGVVDVPGLDPLLLTMPDNRYWRLGQETGKAWGEGKRLKKKE